ncbi:MAG TPA: hypothetical protein VF646_00625 [Cytophagales bacterium]
MKRLICLLGLLLPHLLAQAREQPVTPRHRPRGFDERGVLVDYGPGRVPEFRYDAVFMMAHPQNSTGVTQAT